MTQQTNLFLRNELVIVLVADIRNFTRMSEALPGREFSSLVSEWFRESSDIIQRHGGTIDKFIGDAVMAYWVVASKPDPAVAIHEALETARSLLATASIFSHRLSGQFPGNAFQIGIGLNMGDAMLGNVGTAENQSFTVVGDSVNVAFRLEALTKEQRTPILISQSIVDNAGKHQQFRELGLAEVKGRTTPVSIWTLDFGSEMEV